MKHFIHIFLIFGLIFYLGDLTNGQAVYKANGTAPHAPYQNGHTNGDNEKCSNYITKDNGIHAPYDMPYDETDQPSTNLIDTKRTERNKFFGSLPNHLDSDETCEETRKIFFYNSHFYFESFGPGANQFDESSPNLYRISSQILVNTKLLQ